MIAKRHPKSKKNLSSKDLLQRYLYPLQNQGIIDSVPCLINKNRKIFFPTPATLQESFFHSFIDERNESFDNLRFKVVNSNVYPTNDFLEIQITKALKHSSEDLDSIQQNNSSPKIFDETCKIQKNARMLVEEVFSFPDKYFAKGWLNDKCSSDCEQRENNNESSSITVQNIAVAKSVIPAVYAKNKNEIDVVSLNELLLSLVG